MNEITKTRETGIVNWEEEMAREAREVAAKEVVTTKRISFQGGDIKLPNGQSVANKKLPVIVVDYAYEKAFFEGQYDPSSPSSPVCYALGRDDKDMRPHPNAAKPQAASCKDCPNNEFGSADFGKGKACKDKRRLLVIAGNSTADDVPSTDVLMASLSPTSIKNWATYVKGLKEVGAPPWGVVTQLGTKSEKSYHVVTFELLQKLTAEQYGAIKSRQKLLEDQLLAPYPEPKKESDEPKKKRKF